MVHSNVQPEIGYRMLDKRTYYYGRHGKGVPREFITTRLWWVRGSSWRWKPKRLAAHQNPSHLLYVYTLCMTAFGQASEDRVPWVRTVQAGSDVLKERALRLPNRVPFQTVHNLGMCTWSLYSYVLQAGYELDGRWPRRGKWQVERGRTNGGKVNADAAANVEARHEGDGAAGADGIIRHFF